MISDPKISDPKLPFARDTTRLGVSGLRRKLAPARSSFRCPAASAFGRAVGWFRRIGVLFFVFLCATLGGHAHDCAVASRLADNPLLLPYPSLRDLVASGSCAASARLGVINVWIGFWEACSIGKRINEPSLSRFEALGNRIQ